MKQYKCRKSESISLAFFSLLFFGMVFLFYNNPTRTLIGDLFFIGMGLFGLYALFESLVVITLTDYSIIIKYPLLSEKKINYSDIYSLGDSNAARQLILRDYYGKKLVTIGKSVVGIMELKEELKKKITPKMKIQPREYFVRANSYFVSIISLCFMAAGTIILSIFTKTFSVYPVSMLTLSFLYVLYTFGKQSIFVRLDNTSIVVESLFKKRIILMMEIHDIVQVVNDKSNNGILTTVSIEMKKGKAISLSGFKPDDELLFQSCKYYFDNRRRAT